MTAFARLAPNQQGALFMLGAALGFVINATLTKILTQGGMNPFQVALARAFFAFLALTPFLLRGGLRAFATKHPWIHVTRASAGAAALLLSFYAIARLPLAEVTALSFTTPLFVVGFAVLLLRERVGWRRWTATGVGFLGMLVMVRPGAQGAEHLVQLGTLAAVAQAGLIALTTTMVKRFPKGESQAVMLFYFCVASLVMALPLALPVWRSPLPLEWLYLATIGIVGVAAHWMLLSAFRAGEASFVAPFDYAKLPFAGVTGYLLFHEVPDGWTLFGAVIIIASTIYIAQREARLRRG